MCRPERGRVLAAAVSAVALLGVVLTATPAAAGPTGGPQQLPVMSQSLTTGTACATSASTEVTATPWAQNFLDTKDVWPHSTGTSVLIGLVDTGIDTATATAALPGRVAAGPDVTGGNRAGTDCVGHGTFDATLMAARQRPGVGFAGLAPAADVLAVTATDAAGNTTADWLALGIRAAVDGGARIVAVPLAVAATDPALTAAVGYATARGALVFAPATEDGQAQPAPVYPADLPGVVAVTDFGPGGAAPQSQVRATRVDLSAPGDSLTAVGPGGIGYWTASGPSYAVAYAAATAALVLAAHPELTPAQLRARLTATAYHPGDVMPDPLVGYGAVNPLSAVTSVLPQEHGSIPSMSVLGPMSVPPRRSGSGTATAVVVGVAALGLILLVGGLAAVLPRGRRRGWRPGRYSV